LTDILIQPYLLYGFTGALLIGMAFFAMAIHKHVFRKILAWNVLGSGVFLIIGAFGKRNAPDLVSDPLPQALVITGIVVSVSATALALAIARRLYSLKGESSLEPDPLTPRDLGQHKERARVSP
jgi:multicomponent Na+:H+ antiporter subunit C